MPLMYPIKHVFRNWKLFTAIVQEKAVSYVDQIKDRINEINEEIQQLDSNFRQEKIDGDEYVQKRQSLKHIKDSLKEECSRMGVIPP